MKVYAIPGLATNNKIFSQLSLKDHDLVVLKWPPLKKEYSMADYAACFVDQMNILEPFVLIGLSFGGMLAVEIGKITKPEKIILISSAKTLNGLSRSVRMFKYFPLYLILPEIFFRKASYLFRRVMGTLIKDLAVLAGMVKEMPDNYYKFAIKYIVTWDNTVIPENCILIIGTKDKLMLFDEKFADHIVKDGTHAMVITRAGELSELLKSEINN